MKTSLSRIIGSILALLAIWLTMPAIALAQSSIVKAEDLVKLEIISESSALVPGETHWIGLRQTIEPNWHTYWENAGDAGGPTQVEWNANTPISISPIFWPSPDVIPYEGFLSHAYEDEALLLFQVKIPENASGSNVTLTAAVSYLVCDDICIPGSGKANISLPIATSSSAGINAAEVQKARALLPPPLPYDAKLSGTTLELSGTGLIQDRISSLRFLPAKTGILDHNAAQPLKWQNGAATLQLTPKPASDTLPSNTSGLLLIEEKISSDSTDTLKQAFVLALSDSTYSNGGEPVPLSANAINSGFALTGFVIALASAFAGGLILNLMPCVFPILSIKAMAIASASGTVDRKKGLAFFAGVMVSFALLGGLFLVLRASGAALGWGFQFQSPAFISLMAILFFALGLNMLGLFEIGTSITGTGGRLVQKDGTSGSFFTGALATIAATPCTAPFMGAALGYALSQPTIVAFSVILALGLGFAAPMTMLSLSQRFSNWIPKPGQWMITLRKILAWPLFATTIWLAWVLWLQTGTSGLSILILGLAAIFILLLLFGRTDLSKVKTLTAAAAFVLSAGTAWAISAQMPPANLTSVAHAQSWSETRVKQLQNEGKAVFVDFTAAWCITCKVNEAAVINTQAFQNLLADNDVASLVADWTNQDANIAQELEKFGRAGVPLYLLYSANSETPQVLPQILTQSGMIEAIDKL